MDIYLSTPQCGPASTLEIVLEKKRKAKSNVSSDSVISRRALLDSLFVS